MSEENPTVGESIAADYRFVAWTEHDTFELSMWSYLLRKRTGLLADPERAKKDLADSRFYEEVLFAKFCAIFGDTREARRLLDMHEQIVSMRIASIRKALEEALEQ